MAKEVIKKDGTKQPFDAGKIRSSIAAAAQAAGLSKERKNEVVEQVASAALQLADSKEEIATSELKAKILGDLDQVEPSISAVWREYDQERGA